MTRPNNHARRVSVTRMSKSAAPSSPQDSTGHHSRKAVAVRLKSSPDTVPPEQPEIIAAEVTLPTAEVITEEAALPENPIEQPAAEEIPAEDTPAEDTPAEEEDTPAEDTLAEEEPPAEETPAEDTSAEEEPPVEDTPAEDTPAEEETPAEETPAEETPAEEGIPEEDTPAEETSAEEETPAEETPAEDTPAEEEPPVEDTLAEETPAEEEPPVEDTLAEDTPAEEETPVEETPAEETSADNEPSRQLDTAGASPAEEEAYTNLVYESEEAAPEEPKKWWAFLKDLSLPQWLVPQKWSEISLLRKLIMGASVVLALFSMLPLLVGVLSPGILPPFMIAAFFFLCALYWPLIDGCESTWGNVIIAVVAVCVMAGIVYLSFVSGKMISASANTLREDRADVTVVVLGCKVNGDKPSRMLQARLEAAAEFLLEHPQAHCIVSGGKGPDEQYHEAFVMKNYLVDKGISPMRIIMENASTSTLENINFSAVMAEKYNCHERFLIVTDRFHQYRAMSAANDLGIVSYALNVETVWYLAMPYWFREMAAITRDWLIA